ncbi:MAG: DUF1688 family protein [Rubrivivax sp.]
MSRDPLARLREAATIRARCAAITRAVQEGRSGWFTLDRSRLPEAAQRVAALTRERFPDLRIPYHSRWRHFEAGGVDRKAELDARLAGREPAQVARAHIDLTVVSVLLDAGAGAQWRYRESARPIDALALPVHRQQGDELLAMLGQASGGDAVKAGDSAALGEAAEQAQPREAAEAAPYARSEGLGVASFRGFLAGVFSDDPDDPLRVDARALKRLDAAALRAVFQAGPANPLVGLEGRAALLAQLGQVLEQQAASQGGQARPGRLYDTLWAQAGDAAGSPPEVQAGTVLDILVRDYAAIWRSGSTVLGLPAGDVWPHPWAGAACAAPGTDGSPAPVDPASSGWVPFHKLSQWLTYSLLEPLGWAGFRVTGLEALTGLPEYRNGGLLLDTGVIVPRATGDLARTWKPGDPFVVEWRALTVSLLDELAILVRGELGVDDRQMPLACILEGGTWAAWPQIAQGLRGGAPPVTIDSDGTVF